MKKRLLGINPLTKTAIIDSRGRKSTLRIARKLRTANLLRKKELIGLKFNDLMMKELREHVTWILCLSAAAGETMKRKKNET